VFGWDLSVAGDAARWRECTAVDACGQAERSRPANDLLAVDRVGQAGVDGREVDVLKLSLATSSEVRRAELEDDAALIPNTHAPAARSWASGCPEEMQPIVTMLSNRRFVGDVSRDGPRRRHTHMFDVAGKTKRGIRCGACGAQRGDAGDFVTRSVHA
jgi:hypothetical protein